MMIPNTQDAELLNGLILKEAQLSKVTGYMVKLVEGNGVPLNRALPPPLPRESCHRMEKCLICNMTSEGEKVASRCDIRNIVYVAECRSCWAKTRSEESNNYRRQIYVGESSRSLHERASEHIDGASRCEIGNFIAKHWMNKHH